jgi:hypothetical protein
VVLGSPLVGCLAPVGRCRHICGVETIERPAEWLRLGDVLTAATIIAGSLSAASYAFALGYIFAIEPRFLPAFSFGDLLLLFVSSTSTAIFVAMILIPSVGMLLATRLLRFLVVEAAALHANTKAEGEESVAAEENTVESEELVSPKPPMKAMTVNHWAALIVTMSITLAMTIIAVQDLLSGDRYIFSVFPEFLYGFGIVTMLLAFRKTMLVRLAMPFILSVYMLAAFYVLGDVSGKRDRFGSATSRQMPCVFLKDRSDCLDGLLLGSEAVIVRKNERVVLVSRDNVRSVQSRGPGMLMPWPRPKPKN